MVEQAPTPISKHPTHWKFDYPIYHAETRGQLRDWFMHNGSSRGLWLCSWRTGTERPRCPYPEVVEEAICFGWIDSTISILDDDRGLQLLTPRKPKSSWTRLNRQRFDAMVEVGLMTAAGHAASEVARANGWWTIYDAVEDLREPALLEEALNENVAARLAWDSFPPSARKMMLWWVISAAKEETRQRRVAKIVAKAETGQRAVSS